MLVTCFRLFVRLLQHFKLLAWLVTRVRLLYRAAFLFKMLALLVTCFRLFARLLEYLKLLAWLVTCVRLLCGAAFVP